MSQQHAELMTTFPLFKGYTRHGTEVLIGRGRIRQLAQGDLLFAEGDPAKSVALILSGQAEIFVKRGGRELQLDAVGPSRILGELAVLGGTNRPASARAVEPMAVLEWDELEFRRLIASEVELSRSFRELIRTLAEEEEALVAALAAVKDVTGS